VEALASNATGVLMLLVVAAENAATGVIDTGGGGGGLLTGGSGVEECPPPQAVINKALNDKLINTPARTNIFTTLLQLSRIVRE
jgi:hypothetical protein